MEKILNDILTQEITGEWRDTPLHFCDIVNFSYGEFESEQWRDWCGNDREILHSTSSIQINQNLHIKGTKLKNKW